MKQIRSYFVQKLPNGVYSLTINTFDKWVKDFHINSNYHVYIDCEELKVDEFLPKIEGVWVRSSYINKDQIVIYYIPFYKEWLKNGEIKTVKHIIFED